MFPVVLPQVVERLLGDQLDHLHHLGVVPVLHLEMEMMGAGRVSRLGGSFYEGGGSKMLFIFPIYQICCNFHNFPHHFEIFMTCEGENHFYDGVIFFSFYKIFENFMQFS